MRTLPRARLASSLVLALAAVAAAQDPPKPEGGGEKVAFGLHVNAGDSFHFRADQTVEQKMSIDGNEMETTIKTTQFMRYDVAKVAADGATDLKVTFGAVRGGGEIPMMGAFEFDSTKPASDDEHPMTGMITKPLTALAGKSFVLVIAKDGTIREIRGLKEAMEEVFEDSMPEMGAAMGAMFSDEGMKQQMQANFGRIGTDAAAVGSSWKVDSKVAMPGGAASMNVAATHTLDSATADEAVVSSKMTLTLDEAGASGVVAEMKLGDAKGSQTTRLSRKDGLPIATESETLMKMTLDAPQMGGNIAMDMTQKGKLVRIAAGEFVAQPAAKKAETPTTPEGPGEKAPPPIDEPKAPPPEGEPK